MPKLVFHAPPGWPEPPKGWFPPAGWQPDPSWPAPPPGWVLVTSTGHRVPRWVIKVGSFAVVAVVGLAIAFSQGESESDQAPKVGECARQVGSNAVARVDCSDAQAAYRVTSRHDGTTDIDAACSLDEQATAGFSEDVSVRGAVSVKSFVLCMADLP